jgi:hypothetical protein
LAQKYWRKSRAYNVGEIDSRKSIKLMNLCQTEKIFQETLILIERDIQKQELDLLNLNSRRFANEPFESGRN